MKAARRAFLAQNPFPNPLTLGFFYREKMRAIHQVAPSEGVHRVLEVGGGRSGLAAMLYPEARVTTLDLDPSFADASLNQAERVTFVQGDAVALPFDDGAFDVVTQFDLLEHVPDDAAAASEAVRVLCPGGTLLVSTPHTRWRYPWYPAFRSVAPTEEELFAEWGHVRRGYTIDDLRALIALPLRAWASFINPVTALAHDVAFSRLPYRRRVLMALAPLTWAGYLLHRRHGRGTETASAWAKPL